MANILYMVSGFVEWREKNDASSAWIKSPLILVPVSLMLESLNAPYVLKKYEDDVVVNPTLAYLFERDYGITLPSFDPEEQSINEFMDEMEKLVDRRGWRIIKSQLVTARKRDGHAPFGLLGQRHRAVFILLVVGEYSYPALPCIALRHSAKYLIHTLQ